ncbi:hypothetical protein BS78_07G195900 [Paspalum vaginatum]|nr:hypothetical protein BS78_07G195900 [Paspalum vaginatum]
MQTTVIDSASVVVELKLNYEQLKQQFAPVGETKTMVRRSEAISAGGHTWKISFLCTRDRSLVPVRFAALLRPTTEPATSSVKKVIFHALLDGPTGMINATCIKQKQLATGTCCAYWYWDLDSMGETQWDKDGQLTFLCTITVLNHSYATIPAPPSDICKHLGALLDPTDGTGDVSFTIDGETFRAHRSPPARRSSGRSSSVPWPNPRCRPLICKTLLLQHSRPCLGTCTRTPCPQTTSLALGEAPPSPRRCLSACSLQLTGTRLDRLKLLCAQKLWDNVSVDTVASVLGCAEMYSCPELKSKCIGFFAQEKNFKKAVLLTACLEQRNPKHRN